LLAGCGSGEPRADVISALPPTTTSPAASTTVSPTDPTATTVPSAIAGQAFATYQEAFAVLAELEENPTGRSTDALLPRLMVNPWYSEVIDQIDQLRLKNEVVRGPFSFSDFQLDQVTPDGRVIFTDCQSNSQEVYSSLTGAQVSDTGTYQIREQIVVYHPSSGVWRVADENQGTAHSCS
jgi:hypothetical protein